MCFGIRLFNSIIALKTVLEETYIWFFFSCFISIIWMLTIIYTLGCTHSERQKLISLIFKNRNRSH